MTEGLDALDRLDKQVSEAREAGRQEERERTRKIARAAMRRADAAGEGTLVMDDFLRRLEAE